MNRRFNTAGPNDPGDHYTLPLLARLPDLRRLIDDKLYFALHAPRQAGKTTALLALARGLTDEGRYAGVVLSLASGAPFREDPGMAEDAILDAWRGAASRRLAPALQPPAWPSAPPGHRLARALQAWAEAAPRPLVVFLERRRRPRARGARLHPAPALGRLLRSAAPFPLVLDPRRDAGRARLRDRVGAGRARRRRRPVRHPQRLGHAARLLAQRGRGALPPAHRVHRPGLSPLGDRTASTA